MCGALPPSLFYIPYHKYVKWRWVVLGYGWGWWGWVVVEGVVGGVGWSMLVVGAEFRLDGSFRIGYRMHLHGQCL